MVLFINDSMFSICEQFHLACQLTYNLLNKGFWAEGLTDANFLSEFLREIAYRWKLKQW